MAAFSRDMAKLYLLPGQFSAKRLMNKIRVMFKLEQQLVELAASANLQLSGL